ncbi:MAG: BREX system P-loop protein BrxC, partial [Casimicrobiaceae bacterium]
MSNPQKIHQLFLKPVDRPIEGVIKADDARHLRTELEEYVVTAEVNKGLSEFCERYLNETNANGVWISGFFGSGKSHLLKILSLILDREPFAGGGRAADLLLPRIDDEILRGELTRAVKIPSRSILFNIDQKSDAIGGDKGSPVLEVFVKVLNELQGYYSKLPYVAQFEADLDARGQLAPFKAAYQKTTGRTWESDLPTINTLENEDFAGVYAAFFKKSKDEGLRLFDRSRESYRVSIESFAQRVKAYIDKEGKDFRLNFFVDEAGQFIGQDAKLMLNLQTIAETLSTVCNGRSWVLVTSQGDLQRVLGELEGGAAQDFTKIQARFKTRLTLTSADVREVIQKRLLAKKDAEPEALTEIYDKEKDNLQTLYRFGDQSVEYKGWRGSDEFCAFYPFHPYQFDLFQRAIENLSRHNAFTGKHTSIGERSMLSVFQEVTKQIKNDPVGRLASFDRFFEGIATALQGQLLTSVKQAEKQLDNPVAIRILKALFLLKWVREFKATPRNVAILLLDTPSPDIKAHEKAVREALALLEGQSYLQRNGECFEFLTDVEKDIEVEIKNTEIEESALTRLLSDILYADILRDPKIRYEGNGQDYPYARRLDDELVGRDCDLSVNIITTEHPNHGELSVLAAQNTGKQELLAVLPGDSRVPDEARLVLKTVKYIQLNTGADVDATRKSILTQRGQQNSTRRSNLQILCAELLGKAPLFLNGSRLSDIGEGDARNRLAKGCQALVTFAYPSLRMLKGNYDEALLEKSLLDADDLLAGGGMALSEAEQEVLTYVLRNQTNGERTSVEAIVREMGRRPYGWYPMAVVTLISRLFRLGKVELRSGELLDARAAFAALRNPRLHGGVRVRIQESFDPAKVNALKRFHQEFFNSSNSGTEPRSVGAVSLEAFGKESAALQILIAQASRYPFLSALAPVADRIGKLAGRDYAFLLNQLTDFQDALLDAKQDVLDPIKTFMAGTQRTAFDEAIAYLREEEANFADLPAQDVQPLRDLAASSTPYRGQVLPVARTALTQLRADIAQRLETERKKALAIIDEREAQLRATPEFKALPDSSVTQVLV